MNKYQLGKVLHEARIALAWGKTLVATRQPWPNFGDYAELDYRPRHPLSWFRQAGSLGKFWLTSIGAILSVVILAIWSEPTSGAMLIAEPMHPPSTVDVAILDFPVSEKMLRVPELRVGFNSRAESACWPEMLSREFHLARLQSPWRFAGGRFWGSCHPDRHLIGGGLPKVSSAKSQNVGEFVILSVLSELLFVQKIDILKSYISSQFVSGILLGAVEQGESESRDDGCKNGHRIVKKFDDPISAFFRDSRRAAVCLFIIGLGTGWAGLRLYNNYRWRLFGVVLIGCAWFCWSLVIVGARDWL